MMKKKTSPSVILQIFIVVALLLNIFFLTDTFQPQSESGFSELHITYLTTPDCEDCFPLENYQQYFEDNGVTEDQQKEVAYDSFTGKRLVSKYNITQVPSVVVTGSVNDVEYMQGLIDTVGEFRDDAFVVTKLQPPFIDLEEDRIVGEFDVIYLDDESCDECYDINLHDEVFERMAMKPETKQLVDVSSQEGQQLVDQYEITAVPTILLRGELYPYTGLNQIWDTVGTIEEDDTYVLRFGVTQMGPYKVWPEGNIIYPEEEAETDTAE